MKLLAFSDLHLARARAAELVTASAEADLVIGAGDFCNHRADLDEAMHMLSGITAPIIAVPGNAESFDELTSAALPNMTVLHGTCTSQGDLTFFGLGYGVPVTPFGDWSCDLSNEEAAALLAPCETADILVLHSPPKGVADLTSLDMSVGSTAIRDAIERIQPKLALCGHIHDSWGVTGRIGATQVVNLGPRPNWFDITPET
ncbi:Calcineurin-like phosphoesterase superfamily domain protein [Roseovarius sp. THAF9]|uniref:metallophosphoesterase family protein n=1 Tax=Roseovarius sp. THAF9 TaxID=2587847 RepID=UPI00126914E3|nr:metallophosphoesterase family protein [Roseovarius sp. THAF9]QFT94241.1 Calcineurin-like phosphoesterase superfamily domain protein [Roseovarius sp. THAF9]